MDRTDLRSSIADLACAAPTLCLAGAIISLLTFAVVGVHPLWPAMELTTAEAALVGHNAAFVRQVMNGADPHEPAPVRAGLGDSSARTLTPLQAAIESRETTTLEMVLKYVGPMDQREASEAVCIAHAKAPHLRTLLVAHGAPDVPLTACDEDTR
jgi:hypothetical protein